MSERTAADALAALRARLAVYDERFAGNLPMDIHDLRLIAQSTSAPPTEGSGSSEPRTDHDLDPLRDEINRLHEEAWFDQGTWLSLHFAVDRFAIEREAHAASTQAAAPPLDVERFRRVEEQHAIHHRRNNPAHEGACTDWIAAAYAEDDR